MQLELKKGLELIFQNFETNYQLIVILPSCILCVAPFTSDSQRTFVTLQFALWMTQQSLNLIQEWEEYWKVFGDRYRLNDGAVLP
jgi:hypothetical protein